MPYFYHTETAPLVRFEFVGRLTLEDMERYFSDCKGLLDTGRPHACIVDGSSMLVPEIDFVRRQANWLRDNQEEMRQLNRGLAMVVPSMVIRGLLRAVVHFQEIPVPYATFSELDEATEWARARLSG